MTKTFTDKRKQNKFKLKTALLLAFGLTLLAGFFMPLAAFMHILPIKETR